MGDWERAVAQMENNPHPTPATLPQFVAGLNVLMKLLSVECDLSRRRLKAEIIEQYTRRAEAAAHGSSAVSSGASVGAAIQPKVVNSDAWRALKIKADRMLKRAIEYDRNNEFEDARELYGKALVVYAKAKQQADDADAEAITKAMLPFEKRVKQLREFKQNASLSKISLKTEENDAAWHNRLDKAKECAREAVEADLAGRRVEAMDGYITACDHFLAAIKFGETNVTPQLHKLVQERMVQYMNRAEAIKKSLEVVDTPVPQSDNIELDLPTAPGMESLCSDQTTNQLMRRFRRLHEDDDPTGSNSGDSTSRNDTDDNNA